MYLQKFFAIIRRWLGRERALARCPVASRHRLPAVLFFVSISAARLASASVLVTGDVTPADNPFTLNLNEGLPSDGNFVNPFESQTSQTYYEGRHLDNVVADLNDDTNQNFDITVGKTSFGVLLISGESSLRDQTLTIGGSGMLNGVTRLGTGVVRITGFGSLYNNDPNIYPAPLPNIPGGFSSQTPRPADVGYDLYVGKAGTGTFEISAGARAEIQDAVVVGTDLGSTGNIVVDGFDSYLGSGGFLTNVISLNEPHAMIVGQQGLGYMTITNGATVESSTQSSLAGGITVAASIGSVPFRQGTIPMDPGGSGTVTVNGAASKWITAGSLQVGGFVDIPDGLTSNTDLEGDNSQYNSEFGQGALYVQAGGLVNVHSALGVTDPSQNDLLLAIGRFGRVEMSGGLISVGTVDGENQQSRGENNQVVNDGVIAGTGRIETGIFRNRYLGQVRVGPGDDLVINASARFTDPLPGPGAGPGSKLVPLSNYGLIEVIGTADMPAQLEFERAADAPQNPVQPFLNLPLAMQPTPPAFEGGLISAQHAILRFGSGLRNQGLMAFTAGTNVVSGKVMNIAADSISPDDADVGDSTAILVSGPGTQVVFEDDLGSGVGADINLVNGGNIVVLDQHSFANAGNIGIELSYAHPSLITVSGDVGIGAGAGVNTDLTLNLANDVLHTLKHGDAFQIISFGGDIGGVDLTDPSNPVVDLSIAPLFTDIDTSPDLSVLHPNLDLIIQFSNQGVYAVFLDPLMVGAGAMGPDFNGDGFVDGADLAIWLANVGIASGGSVLVGDADGDGDVDGADFLVWQLNLGPYPGAGAGSGGALPAAVPEPTGIALLLLAGFFSLPIRRRRGAR